MAPQVGFEPTTLRLTAECSAIELLRSVVRACMEARPFDYRVHHNISSWSRKAGRHRITFPALDKPRHYKEF